VEGTFEKGKVDIWGAVASLLRNGFVRALLPKTDDSVDMGDAVKAAGDLNGSKLHNLTDEKVKHALGLGKPAAPQKEKPPAKK
jgi:hypothetical protein